ncbi:MAG: hypothetical protein WDZ52_12465 [Pseudohongiellaceae bacterium]
MTMLRASCVTIGTILILSAVVPPPLHGQSLSRLFLTPAERADLDRRRFQAASGIATEEPVDDEPFIEIPLFTEDEEDVVYAIGGTMRKTDGSYTVWINNIAYDQTSLPRNMELLSPFSRGQLRIRDTRSNASFDVKPGQVLNLSTGQLFESYQYQAALAEQEAVEESQETGSIILDSAAVEAVLEAAQDL